MQIHRNVNKIKDESLLVATLLAIVSFSQTSKQPFSTKDRQLSGDNLELDDINQMLSTMKKKAAHTRPGLFTFDENFGAQTP